MFGMQILDVALGLVFLYFVLSIICSAAGELVASFTNVRGRNLQRAILNLLPETVPSEGNKEAENIRLPAKQGEEGQSNEPKTLGKQVLDHTLIATLSTRKWFFGVGKSPSYIPSRVFALALLDNIVQAKEDSKVVIADIRDRLKGLPECNIKRTLLIFLDEVGNDMEKLRNRIGAWFDDIMDRVSGSYKRWSQLIVFIIAAIIVFIANADTLQIVKTLSTDSTVRQAISSQAQAFVQQQSAAGTVQPSKSKKEIAATPAKKLSPAQPQQKQGPTPPAKPTSRVKENPGSVPASQATPAQTQEDPFKKLAKGVQELQELQILGLPLGWKESPFKKPWNLCSLEVVTKLIGLLLTVFAVSLGAPFWFDLLTKIVNIRGANKPVQTTSDEGEKKK